MDESILNVLECPGCCLLLEEPVLFPRCHHVSCRSCAHIIVSQLVGCPWCGEASLGSEIVPVPLIAKVVSTVKEVDKRLREEEPRTVKKKR